MLNLNKTLVDFLEQAIECYIMTLPQQYALPTEIKDFQQGYKIDANTGKNISNEQEGGFHPSWYIIAKNYFADPIFIDSREQGDNYPVYFAFCGQGKWQPILISASLSKFMDQLNDIKKFEDDSVCLLDYLAANTDIDNEFWQEVYEAAADSNNDDD